MVDSEGSQSMGDAAISIGGIVGLQQDGSSKQIRGYCMYDWAKSAFETSVTVAILPVWFTYLFLEANGLTANLLGAEMSSDAVWAYSVAIATLLVAMVSPSFGVIADRRRIKMKALKWLTWIGSVSVFLLAITPLLSISFQWMWIMIMFMLANIGLNGAGVFYNALLPHIGEDHEMDSISNKAYAYGYLGGGLLLIFHLGLVMGVSGDWVVPFCMASSGLWWFGFAWYTFAYVNEPMIENELDELTLKEASIIGVSEVLTTLKESKNFKTLFIYMIAYFLFIDGINSVTSLAGAFGVTTLGLTAIDLMITIVIIQFVAFPSAFFFTWLAERLTTKKALTFSLVLWCVMIVGAMGFAPLELSESSEYDLHFESIEGSESYTLSTLNEEPFGSSDDDQAIQAVWQQLLDGGNVSAAEAESLVLSLSETRFSAWLNANVTMVGVDHPTNLGDGEFDAVPIWVRGNVWAPLGITIFFQWLILGCLAGILMGGSQGLARSLFSQMIPETRSAEFFGFFGFFGKVAAFMGPLLYGTLSIMFDSRVAISSLAMLIIAGTIMMYWVDVDDGIAVANAEDERNRAKNADTTD